MLVLERDIGQAIVIDGKIIVRLLRPKLRSKRIVLGVEAPKGVTIHREEIQRLIDSQYTDGSASGTGVVS